MLKKKLKTKPSYLSDFIYSQRCVLCGKISIVSDDEVGEIICAGCGYVISEKIINLEPPRNLFSNDKIRGISTDKSTLARHDKGLSTVISRTNRDASGKALSPLMKSITKRFHVWEKRNIISVDKNFQHAFIELQRMKEKIGISDAIVEKSAYIYRKAIEHKLTKGRSISALMAASLYAACRITGTPRTIKDIQKVTNVSRREMTRCYRLLVVEFNFQMPIVDAVQCVTRIANNVGVSEKTKRFAIEILKKAKKYRLAEGKDPTSMAAAAIYLAGKKMKESFSQKLIANAANITEITIRNRMKGFEIILQA